MECKAEMHWGGHEHSKGRAAEGVVAFNVCAQGMKGLAGLGRLAGGCVVGGLQPYG